MNMDKLDPRGLIKDSYEMQGIGDAECRTIFLDWALGIDQQNDLRAMISTLLDKYAKPAPKHPMTQVLKQGLTPASHPKRSGGRRGKQRPN